MTSAYRSSIPSRNPCKTEWPDDVLLHPCYADDEAAGDGVDGDEHLHDRDEEATATGSTTIITPPIEVMSSNVNTDEVVDSPMDTGSFPCPFPFLNTNPNVDVSGSTLVMTTCRTCNREYIGQITKMIPCNRASMFRSLCMSSNIVMGMNEYCIASSSGLGIMSILTHSNYVAYMPLSSITDVHASRLYVTSQAWEGLPRATSTSPSHFFLLRLEDSCGGSLASFFFLHVITDRTTNECTIVDMDVNIQSLTNKDRIIKPYAPGGFF
ncbi:hypothetical protein AYL99_11886 [Fonsecaea erecta]|uniref:Uncharacterized protein n=1 Tax=Fonsecaea erecta TaxID=1367422 RepID=A0A178Z2D9_9EURO|nr:hypothetical protein AYL99_11886 [Fonsecaea erecta]OAP53864.1 hypothetical protein AYL99_11886 [Fonsecaea erecta]